MAEGQELGAREEIAALERLLAEKKLSLLNEGKKIPEREAFRETFRETYGDTLAPKTNTGAQPQPAILPNDVAGHASDVLSKAREEQVDTLIEIALRKGIATAAEVAKKATPWLMDELHDRLQDRYYDQLLQLRKLRAL